jgi:murein DD-endopeptidase MepM/ murein hydrolase activator NlpD
MRGVHHSGSDFSEAVRAFLRHHYVERQIYLRSHGHVQFVSLSPFTQAVFLAIGLAALSWVAFSSVNVIFKDEISTSRDQRFVRMQSAYEERVAQIQSAYDELNGQLVISQERFLATTRELEDKHRQLTALMSQRQTANSELDAMRRRYAATMHETGGADRGDAAPTPADPAGKATDAGSTVAGPQHAADADSIGANAQPAPASQIDARLARLDRAQQGLINSVEETTDRRIRELASIIGMTDVIDVKALVKGTDDGAAKAAAGKGEGGPFLRLSDGKAMAAKGGDKTFSKQLFRVSHNLMTMGELENVIAKMPLAEPLINAHETSGFGPRRDPFNGRMAFHAGMDLASDYGATVYATAPGTVTYADWKGAYGRLVEIDQGNGFVTRYGHLSAITVKVGQKISFRDVIGRVGSTGRSSGPHLHYEVWYDGIVRDPSRFIEAGHHVFAKQG